MIIKLLSMLIGTKREKVPDQARQFGIASLLATERRRGRHDPFV
jgi:hypothetical protein